MPFLKFIRLANFARTMTQDDILTFTASGEISTSDYAGSILIPDQQNLDQIIRDYF
jgi:hypothetical protein